jgi:riboflavin biosynthesis pyrimidine reductase
MEQTGARIFSTPVCDDGRLNLDFVLQTLEQEGLRRLMVEGGVRVITAFLTQQLVDAVVITIAPFWLAGIAAPSNGSLEGDSSTPRIFNPQMEQRGDDFILFGSLNQGANQ